MLALLIAVATALMFTTAIPTTPPGSLESEMFCAPEAHDTPFLSKQESGERNAPRGETHALAAPRIGGPAFTEIQALGAAVFLALQIPARTRPAGGLYPRGPPTLA